MNIFTSILPNRTLRRAGLVLAAAAMVTAAFAGPVQPARAGGSINFPPPLGLYPDLTPISLKATRLNADFVEFAFTVKNQGSYSAKVGS